MTYPWPGCMREPASYGIADGPDEVHKILIAKNVLKQYGSGEGWDFGN